MKLNQIICTYLIDSGFETKGCLNAQAAYDEICHSLYHMIVSDVILPGIDGFEFARMVRKINRHILILFMSAKDDLSPEQSEFHM